MDWSRSIIRPNQPSQHRQRQKSMSTIGQHPHKASISACAKTSNQNLDTYLFFFYQATRVRFDWVAFTGHGGLMMCSDRKNINVSSKGVYMVGYSVSFTDVASRFRRAFVTCKRTSIPSSSTYTYCTYEKPIVTNYSTNDTILGG